jgi:hypothetical protein
MIGQSRRRISQREPNHGRAPKLFLDPFTSVHPQNSDRSPETLDRDAAIPPITQTSSDTKRHPQTARSEPIFQEEFSLEKDFVVEGPISHPPQRLVIPEKRVKYEWMPAKLLKQRFGL